MRQYDFRKEYDASGKETVSISNKRKRKLEIIPMLFCVLLAFIIWIYCVNITVDDVTTTFTVKLDILGKDELPEGMQVYSGDDTLEITMTVQGTNRDINKYKASDYTASIDVSEISEVGWTTLEIKASTPKGAENSTLSILNTNIDKVSVYTDVMGEKTVPIKIKEETFSKPSNYAIDFAFSDGDNSIIINGPQTLVDQIVQAEYISERKEEFNKSTDLPLLSLKFYNANGELVSNGGNNREELSSDFITYAADKKVLNVIVGADMPLNFQIVGAKPQYQYVVHPVTATVTGDPSLVTTFSPAIDAGTLEVGENKLKIQASELGFPAGVQLKSEYVEVIVEVIENQTPAS